MSLENIASLGKSLAQFLALFAGCFNSVKGRMLLAAYVRGLLSELQRKNVEAIALKQGVAPRTLQGFVESLKWDHEEVLCRARELVASEHADPDAIGVIDETGTAKSGCHTVGVKRQYNGNRGKVENAVVNVALSYATRNFQCLIAAGMYLPKEWAEDPVCRKNHIPDDIEFLTKPQIALVLVDQSLADGIAVKAWTFDELYGRDGKFLDGLDERNQAFMGEVPPDLTKWTRKPKVLRKPPRNQNGRPRYYPRLAARDAKPCEVQNLCNDSPGLSSQTPQRYRVRDSHKGP